MTNNLKRYFREIDRKESPSGLIEGIMTRITREKKRDVVLHHLLPLSFGVLLSATITVFTVRLTIADALQTGLGNFLSMTMTDSNSVLHSWQSYSLTILDAIPVAPIVGTCAALCIFFLLLRRIDNKVTLLKMK